jgi:hypothetical protein
MIRHFLSLMALIAISLHAQAAPARVAILGDSITHDGRWATRVEAALRSTPEFAKAEIVNFGLGGLPLDQADAQAAEQMKAYLERVPAVSAGSGATGRTD